MKLKILKSFKEKLTTQIDFIAKDKPQTARMFKKELINKLKEIPNHPLTYRKSIFFDRNDIRDLIFKGYVIVFKIKQKEKEIEVFGLTKYENNPF